MCSFLVKSFPVLSADIRIWVMVWVSVISAKIGRTFWPHKCRKSPEILRFQDFDGCGGRIWTNDLRVMSCGRLLNRLLLCRLTAVQPSFVSPNCCRVLRRTARWFPRMGQRLGQTRFCVYTTMVFIADWEVCFFAAIGSNLAPLYSKNKAMCWPAGGRPRFRPPLSRSHIRSLCWLNHVLRLHM